MDLTISPILAPESAYVKKTVPETHLVLGSAGFVGAPFCDFLREQGVEVIEWDIKDDPSRDLRSCTIPLADYVWFLAWDVGGAKWLYEKKNQMAQFQWNSELMLNVFEHLSTWPTPFTFVSTQMATIPETVYGAQKRLGELIATLLGGTVVRLWNVYGPQEDESERSHVVGDVVRQALSGHIALQTNGAEKRRFVHIDDVCRGLWQAHHPGQISELYGGLNSVIDVVEIVADAAGVEWLGFSGHVAARDDARWPVGPKLDGWWPRVGLKEGIRRMLQRD